jgi:hypothetical protein
MVSEKKFGRQVHKSGLTLETLTEGTDDILRLVNTDDLRKVFELGLPGTCNIAEALQSEGIGRVADTDLPPCLGSTSSHVISAVRKDEIYKCAQNRKAMSFGGTTTNSRGPSLAVGVVTDERHLPNSSPPTDGAAL